ncbi:hypothetical protein Pelo_18667 [Pelomyxa schiedti]|nr:hypothetical protein Pelo_18667 [Pelomyxa schiedti]
MKLLATGCLLRSTGLMCSTGPVICDTLSGVVDAHVDVDVEVDVALVASALHLTDTDLQLAGKSSANAQRKAISDWAAKTGNMETTKTAVASIKEKQAQVVPQQQPRKRRPSASQVAPIPKETATAPQPKRPRKR